MYEIRGTRTGKLYGKTETYPAADAMAVAYGRRYGEPMRIKCPRA